jgi:hypothetical protein
VAAGSLRNAFDKISPNQYQTASAFEAKINDYEGHDPNNTAQFDNGPEILVWMMYIFDQKLADSDRRIRHARLMWFLNEKLTKITLDIKVQMRCTCQMRDPPSLGCLSCASSWTDECDGRDAALSIPFQI